MQYRSSAEEISATLRKYYPDALGALHLELVNFSEESPDSYTYGYEVWDWQRNKRYYWSGWAFWHNRNRIVAEICNATGHYKERCSKCLDSDGQFDWLRFHDIDVVLDTAS